MKELSIKEKAKAYDRALEIANAAYKDEDRHLKATLERIFPGLCESEDEKIRKELIEHVKDQQSSFISAPDCRDKYEEEENNKYNSWLDWLEKQNSNVDNANKEYWRGYHEGKQEILDKYAELKKQGEQKPADKVEPKFKVGDWVVQGYNILKIKCVGDTHYCFETVGGYVDDMLVSEIDSQFHLWTIQDAKDGDVLQLGKVTAIFQKYIGNGNCKCYCSVCDGVFEIPSKDGADNSYGCYNAIPATKEQRDLLFQKMKEAGYKWDAKKKELKLLITNGGDFFESENCEQKHVEWSEEDERICNNIINDITNDKSICKYEIAKGICDAQINWLKSLKERIGG